MRRGWICHCIHNLTKEIFSLLLFWHLSIYVSVCSRLHLNDSKRRDPTVCILKVCFISYLPTCFLDFWRSGALRVGPYNALRNGIRQYEEGNGRRSDWNARTNWWWEFGEVNLDLTRCMNVFSRGSIILTFFVRRCRWISVGWSTQPDFDGRRQRV